MVRKSPVKQCPQGQTLRKGYTRKAYCKKDEKCYPEKEVAPTCVTIRGICPEGEILRLGYTRKAYTRSTGAKVLPTKVPPKCIPDKGAKGRGPKIIKMRKDLSLRNYGYSTTKTLKERKEALDKAVKEHGAGPVVVRLNKLVVLQGRNPTAAKKFLEDLKYVQTKYKYNKLY